LFLYYGLQSWDLLADLDQAIKGATLNKAKLKRIPIYFPRHQNVQRAIAGVLDKIDCAIEQTEALLAKQQRIKTGLMEALFTLGLDSRGHLRDTATHPFKPSIFGPIPIQWDVKPLASCTRVPITYGIVQAGPHIPGGIPYIRTGDMDGDELIRETMLCTSIEIASHFRRSEVCAGEIVCAIRATVGKVLPVPENLDGANLTQGTARIAPNSDTNPRFLLWAIRNYRTQQEIRLQSKGTTFAEITLTALREIPVVMPRDLDEQVQIARVIDGSDLALTRTRTRLEKLKRTKAGLMQDLLTARIPVAPLLSNSAS
jgi:type I restriction enzyme S subunit